MSWKRCNQNHEFKEVQPKSRVGIDATKITSLKRYNQKYRISQKWLIILMLSPTMDKDLPVPVYTSSYSGSTTGKYKRHTDIPLQRSPHVE